MKHLTCLPPFVLVFALMLSAAPAADAQFGGLMKKAKDKIAEKAKEDLGPVEPGEQLTDDLVAKVIIGVQTAKRLSDERKGVQLSSEPKNRELSALVEANRPVHAAYDEPHMKIHMCRAASMGEANRARKKAVRSDPARNERMRLAGLKYGKALGDAHQRHDDVAVAKLQDDMAREIEGDDAIRGAREDSVAADIKCGTLPPLPASLAQESKLRNEIRAIDDSLRTLQTEAGKQAVQASGLVQLHYFQLKERIRYIMSALSGQSRDVHFSDEEMAAVKARLGDLEKLRNSL